MSLMKKVLSMCETYAFLRPVITNNYVEYLKYGPSGELLCQNIRNEWLYSNVTSREESVFQTSYGMHKNQFDDIISLKDSYENAKLFCNNHLPFSITDSRSQCEQNTLIVNRNNEESSLFNPKQYTRLKYIAFCIPEEGQQFFYHWQRQRKIWWRKFSANPGKFSLTEILTDESGQEYTEIKVEFDWGQETIETIRNIGTKLLDKLDPTNQELFLAKVGKKKLLPHIIESETSLEKASLVLLCDGYADLPYHNERRETFRFHRKIAPYKITFASPLSNAKKADELRQLSVYLGLGLKKAGVSTLLSPNIAKKTLDSQFIDADCLGIPYTAVLTESTLDNGIIGLRSIETTLEEKIHVANLTSYVELLVKNY
ncbi:DNA polymerase subunit gamma-2, mitochondrial [Daktulosphaira vitifoliae]|uniref:DNA polymerase subunit gamma-2, mitochondrial n=1 Tax=Daktulosphaira vitifoliae TaxID=58002 RepID=UPI0021AA6188|nr:DNA polymerase subunit gamma-2, mitochondrial [Daktulosphaira vitifoliae]XP_050523560.1 DNA polymerase subunit gamma-2, mitochondrial [Daktulosphaira vitifoliae]